MADTNFIAAATYDSLSSASAEVSKPVGTVENDIMFALIGRISVTAEPNSVPAGWTLIGFDTNAYGQYYGLYYKVAGGGEPATYTWAWADATQTKISIATYRGGFNTGDPIDTSSNVQYIVNNTLIRAASMTVTDVNSNLIFAGQVYTNADMTITKPDEQDNNWIEDYDNWHWDPDIEQTFCHCNWSGSGASGIMDATLSGAKIGKHAFAVALNVAGAPPAEVTGNFFMFL